MNLLIKNNRSRNSGCQHPRRWSEAKLTTSLLHTGHWWQDSTSHPSKVASTTYSKYILLTRLPVSPLRKHHRVSDSGAAPSIPARPKLTGSEPGKSSPAYYDPFSRSQYNWVAEFVNIVFVSLLVTVWVHCCRHKQLAYHSVQWTCRYFNNTDNWYGSSCARSGS